MPGQHSILVIDDEQVVLDAMKRILEAQGYPVHTAEDAERGQALLESAKPDMVVVDLKLPGRSGLDFLRSARADFPEVPVIVCTGFSSVDQAIESLRGGAFDFLPKPFTFDELLGPVRRACRYLDLREELRFLPRTGLPGYYALGTQSWARPDPDGSARIGLTELLQATIGPIQSVGMPELDDGLLQGGRLATITSAAGGQHVTWSALSGRVVAVNRDLELDPGLLNRDPFGAGWIVVVRPTGAESELAQLRSLAES